MERAQGRRPETLSRRSATPSGRRGTSSRYARPSRPRPPFRGTWSRAPSGTETEADSAPQHGQRTNTYIGCAACGGPSAYLMKTCNATPQLCSVIMFLLWQFRMH
ncbi:hypothetical protein VPH35_045406 [Triticum aestivum]